jgi:uncharacterized protein (DUF849 family)
VVELKPDICSLDLNTMWFGGGAVINSPHSIRIMAERIYAAGVKPELEVFDTGDIHLAHALIKDGTLRTPALFQIVTGVQYGMAANPETLAYAKSLLPENCDTVYLAKGVKTPDNAALVAKAARIIDDLGGTIATVNEARELLGIA